MPKPFPVLIHIEEIALGAVLRKLHEMPGVSGVDLQLGQGGQGAGKQQLEHGAQAKRGNQEEGLIELLLQGPKHLNDMVAAIGGKKGSFYTLTSKLRQKGII